MDYTQSITELLKAIIAEDWRRVRFLLSRLHAMSHIAPVTESDAAALRMALAEAELAGLTYGCDDPQDSRVTHG